MDTKINLLKIYDQFGINPEEELNSQLDSLDFVTLIIEIEENFNVSVPEDLLNVDVLTTDKLVNLIDQELEKGN
ncbi:hypothetical protein EBB07_09850 [Paenibacillaceae bacterium]|nr:hypothetical protein EBB07_09850 [Paenibacillaceae bacterium]